MTQRKTRQMRRWLAKPELHQKRFIEALDRHDKKRKMGRNMLRPDVWTYLPFTGSGLIHNGRKP